jgi:hypothetical protein
VAPSDEHRVATGLGLTATQAFPGVEHAHRVTVASSANLICPGPPRREYLLGALSLSIPPRPPRRLLFLFPPPSQSIPSRHALAENRMLSLQLENKSRCNQKVRALAERKIDRRWRRDARGGKHSSGFNTAQPSPARARRRPQPSQSGQSQSPRTGMLQHQKSATREIGCANQDTTPTSCQNACLRGPWVNADLLAPF